MKYFTYLFFCITVLNFTPAFAQQTIKNCACCTKEYDYFDFWLGKWEVYDIENNLIGINSISKQPDNCLILEKWINDARRGSSTIFYNKTNNSWNQIWVDSDGYVIKLTGNLEENIMVLKSELIKGTNRKYYNKITWTPNIDGSITQLWDIYNENDIKISDVFKGIYKKTLN